MTTYTATITADLTGGRYPAQEYTVKYQPEVDEDRWGNRVVDLCIKAVMKGGVDIDTALNDEQMQIIEAALEALRKESETDALISQWECNREDAA